MYMYRNKNCKINKKSAGNGTKIIKKKYATEQRFKLQGLANPAQALNLQNSDTDDTIAGIYKL
jgi:hypothetical protein